MGMLIVSFFSAVSCFIINAVTIIVMLRRRFSNPQNGKQGTSKAIPELKLFLLSMLMFVNEVILGIIQVILQPHTLTQNFKNLDRILFVW